MTPEQRHALRSLHLPIRAVRRRPVACPGSFSRAWRQRPRTRRGDGCLRRRRALERIPVHSGWSCRELQEPGRPTCSARHASVCKQRGFLLLGSPSRCCKLLGVRPNRHARQPGPSCRETGNSAQGTAVEAHEFAHDGPGDISRAERRAIIGEDDLTPEVLSAFVTALNKARPQVLKTRTALCEPWCCSGCRIWACRTSARPFSVRPTTSIVPISRRGASRGNRRRPRRNAYVTSPVSSRWQGPQCWRSTSSTAYSRNPPIAQRVRRPRPTTVTWNT